MNINREIWRITGPAVITNLTVPLLGLCDTTVSGHLGGEFPMAGTAVGALMFNVIFWLFGFLRMGTTGLTAQLFGAGADTRRVLKRVILLAFCIGGAMIALQVPMELLLTEILSPGEEVTRLAHRYFSVAVWSAPAVLATMGITGWFIGCQNTFIPMIVSIVVNLLNIGLSILFVFGMEFSVPGIALGTLGANWGGLVLVTWFMLRELNRLKIAEDDENWNAEEVSWWRFFKVNGDIFLRSACIMAITIGLSAFGNRMGALIVACNAIMMQFFHFFSYFMDGFAYAGEALVGRFIGAQNPVMTRRSISTLLKWSAGCALFFFAVYAIAGNEIVALICNDAKVVEATLQYMPWILLIPPCTVGAFIFDGFFIGATATGRMLWVTAVASSAFFVVNFIHPWQSPGLGLPDNNTLWTAFLVYLFLRGLLLALQTRKIIPANPTPITE